MVRACFLICVMQIKRTNWGVTTPIENLFNSKSIIAYCTTIAGRQMLNETFP